MKLKAIFCAALLFVLSLSVHADTYKGTAYRVSTGTANNVPTAGNVVGSGTVLATFDASSINFSGDGPNAYSLGGFLNSFGAASNIVYASGASAASDLTNTLFEFTGMAYFTNGQTFSVLHDDGVNLYVDGKLVLGQPTPTPPVTSFYTYTGNTGNFNFDFIYANGPPTQADFKTNLVPTVAATPEPSSLALLGTGALSLAGVIRRKLAKVS